MSKWILGGPCYNQLIDARHAAQMASLATMLGDNLLGMNYRHGVPVELARDEIFTASIKSPADFLFQVDADIYGDFYKAAFSMAEYIIDSIPMISVLYKLRDETPSVYLSETDKPWHQSFFNKPEPCWAAGTGAVLYNLSWYRKNWKSPQYFRTDYPNNKLQSEDIWHCRELARQNASAYYAFPCALQHAHRGG